MAVTKRVPAPTHAIITRMTAQSSTSIRRFVARAFLVVLGTLLAITLISAQIYLGVVIAGRYGLVAGIAAGLWPLGSLALGGAIMCAQNALRPQPHRRTEAS
jgi:hypothetical protein